MASAAAVASASIRASDEDCDMRIAHKASPDHSRRKTRFAGPEAVLVSPAALDHLNAPVTGPHAGAAASVYQT
jgi:hypothetical protein